MKKLFIIFTSLILLTGCSQISSLWAQEIYEAPSGAILFLEEFTDDKNGWRTWHDDGSHITYQAEGFRFYANQANYDFWSTPGYSFQDMQIDVEALKLGGPDDNAFGVICRYVDADNFYAFLISSDGYAGIGLYKDGVRSLLSGDSMFPSSAVHPRNATNSIIVHCVENSLLLEVNGTLVYELESEALQIGDIGLIAGSYESSGLTVLFDDFSVRNP